LILDTSLKYFVPHKPWNLQQEGT